MNERNEKENVQEEARQERKVNKVLILRFAFTPGKLNLIFKERKRNIDKIPLQYKHTTTHTHTHTYAQKLA